MRPKERDLAYLWDMREAAREISDFVRGISFAKFEENHLIRYAVERIWMAATKSVPELLKELNKLVE